LLRAIQPLRAILTILERLKHLVLLECHFLEFCLLRASIPHNSLRSWFSNVSWRAGLIFRLTKLSNRLQFAIWCHYFLLDAKMSDLKDEKLDFWIKNHYNVLFVGKHGVGKTSIIKAALFLG
jgi:hypothetical protein